MKIIHVVNHHLNVGNGIVNVAIDLACLQARAGHDVYIASGEGDFAELLSEYGVKVLLFPQRRSPRGLLHAGLRFRQILATVKPDIVHAHMMTGAVIARFLKFTSRFTLVSSVHNEFQRSSIAMGVADVVIAVSDAVAVSMKRRGIPARRLRVVRNGTIGSPRTAEAVTPVGLLRPSITTVAGLYDRKGISDLISAFETVGAQFPSAHLYIVGDGPKRAEFQRQALETTMRENIHFEGFQKRVKSYLHETSIFVLASHADPFPLVLPEAREAGCAIVATDVDGIPEALERGRCGILVPPHDPDALAAALSTLLADESVRSSWALRAQSNCEWLSARRVVEETMSVYESRLRR